MAAPFSIIPPPIGNMDPTDLVRWFYDNWTRTGGYNTSIPDLAGLVATVTELNYSVGVTSLIQDQLNSKASISSLGSMAFQNSASVSITGGTLTGVTITASSGTITTFLATSATITTATIPTFGSTTATISTANITTAAISTGTVIAGASAVTANIGGTLTSIYTPIGNTAGVETNLMGYSLFANMLENDGDSVEIRAWGSFANNANNKDLKLYFGTTVIFDSASAAFTNSAWNISAQIVRITQTTQTVIVTVVSSDNTLTSTAQLTATTEDLSTALAIQITGNGVAANDIVQDCLIIKWVPA